MEISSDKKRIAPIQIESFIEKLDKDFIPPISTKVVVSEYAEKVYNNATIYFTKDEIQINGLIAFYCNDRVQLKGYISYFAIDDSHRGMGIGRMLLGKCIACCKEAGMAEINVETWAANKAGIVLYKSLGFNVVELVNDRPNDQTAKLKLIL